MTEPHPAVLASENSAKYAMAGDKAAWVALFAEDAFLADPVGPSPFDPKGEGFSGKAGVEKFWDKAIGPSTLNIKATSRIPCANVCAAHMTVTNDLGRGKSTVTEMIGIYEVNEEGLLSSLKVYWSFPALAKQLKELGFGA